MKNKKLYYELMYIQQHYDFSPKIKPEIKNLLIESGLIELDKDTDLVFLTISGEEYLGVSKDELFLRYGELDGLTNIEEIEEEYYE